MRSGASSNELPFSATTYLPCNLLVVQASAEQAAHRHFQGRAASADMRAIGVGGVGGGGVEVVGGWGVVGKNLPAF